MSPQPHRSVATGTTLLAAKLHRPIRVWLAAPDGHRTCGLLYPAAVPGFRFQENARVFHGAAH